MKFRVAVYLRHETVDDRIGGSLLVELWTGVQEFSIPLQMFSRHLSPACRSSLIVVKSTGTVDTSVHLHLRRCQTIYLNDHLFTKHAEASTHFYPSVR